MNKSSIGIGTILVGLSVLWALARKPKSTAQASSSNQTGAIVPVGPYMPLITPAPKGPQKTLTQPAAPPQFSTSAGVAQVQEAQAIASATTDAHRFTQNPPSLATIREVESIYVNNPNAVIQGYFRGEGMGLQPESAMNWLREHDPDYQKLPPPQGWPSWTAVLAYEAMLAGEI